MQPFQQCIATELAQVDKLIVEQLHSEVPLVPKIGEYIVNAGGKRLRPTLALLAGGTTGAINESHVQLATIIEFIHTATLLHDDVVDVSERRRGRLTANANWGNAPAVLVGDFIYSRAFQLMARIGNQQLIQILADTTNTIAEGEVLQLTKAGDTSTSEADYFKVIEYKTAILFAAAAKAGALLSGASTEIQTQLGQYALHLGIAFQLVDDLLDYQGNPAETGKNIGDDLSEGKPTLPLIFAMKNANIESAQIVKNALKNKDCTDILHITDIVTKCGGLAYTRQRAQEHTEKALDIVGGINSNQYLQSLVDLSHSALARMN